ncbi:hypothetical protein CEQ90_03940 [Lewinellaceae bacterium SD302]|nr:hypothetical protein CEQ90_03940 [Lewinellaceae bacterium SD302]
MYQKFTFPLLMALLAVIFLGFSACSPKVATMGDGSDGVDWSARAKAYQKNPESLRTFTEACEENEALVTQLRSDLNRAQSAQNSSGANYQNAQAELQDLRRQLNEAQSQLTVAQNALANRDEMITDQSIANGIVFRVQLGAFAQPGNKLDNDLDTGDGLNLSDQQGLQKVVVSQFRTYDNARKLRDRLRQMGVKDAFVVALNNGQRVEVQEALRLSGQQ